jgi:SpoVK/Ycf46/Vps4 family AAA+-type ATPase
VTWSKSQRVLQRLVLATYVGRFVHEEDTIGISFQGKGLELKVERLETEPRETMTMNELISEMANVNIDLTTTPETEIEKALRRGLQEGERRNSIRLYKFTQATEIVLLHDKIYSSKATDAWQESKEGESRRVVAGLDTILHQVISLLSPPLMRPDLFRNHSLRPPRGVLLYGPSGCGKSLLAHQVKLDLESDVNMRTINCTSLQSCTAIVGEAERHLTRIFQSAEKNNKKSGTLLILDDIHLICPKRGGTNQGADRLAATLLALLDGIGTATDDEGRGNLVILGITSNPSLLDPALRRPGRLDSEVEIPIPDEVARAEIIKFQLERLGLGVSMPQWTETDFMALSRLAKGFNGADVMLAIKEALRKAILGSSLSSIGLADSNMISLTRSHLEASIRATKPSTISSITVEIPQVHWTSIGGMDGVKQKLRESIELPITHAHLFEALNIPPPRGVLLYGPPGCSKTLMARALATEGRMNFLAVKGPELLSKWLGESERALASLFRRARMASPCIIFFDEIDAIASKRGEGSAGGERLLSQLLTELDGISSGSFTKPERVIVVGATNRPDLLDSALTRPGRIDRMIYVGLPDEASRAHIFEIGLKGKACSSDIQVSVLASDAMSGGFSGAELIAICREAALLAIEEDDEGMEGSPRIAMRHLIRAVTEMHRQITPEMLDFYASFHTNKI